MGERFCDFVTKIEQAYCDQGHHLGWRFLHTAKDTFPPSSDFGIVGLNPGSEDFDISAESRNGNAFRIPSPSWNKALQVQVHRLFALFADESEVNALMDRSFSANFVPFRSKSWRKLHNRKAAIPFSVNLWREILALGTPKVVFCIGKQTYKLLEQCIPGAKTTPELIPTGWGKMHIEIVTIGQCTVVALPHLSQYKIFGRTEGKQMEACLRKKLRGLI